MSSRIFNSVVNPKCYQLLHQSCLELSPQYEHDSIEGKTLDLQKNIAAQNDCRSAVLIKKIVGHFVYIYTRRDRTAVCPNLMGCSL